MDAVSDSSTKKVDSPDRMWSRAPCSSHPDNLDSRLDMDTIGVCDC